MLEERVQEWTRDWREQGVEDGRKEGRREGEAAVVEGQLERKFGPLSAEDRQRIQNADADTLMEWGMRILDADSLADVFA